MLLAILFLLFACETKRIEYRRRPDLMTLGGGDLPAVTVTADGTEIHWIDDESRQLQGFEQTIGQERVRIREEHDEGGVVLRSVIPMHLTINLLECLRRGEYQVIYDQLISDDKRRWYEARGADGYDAFLGWFRARRKEIGSTLNRMRAGKVFGEVLVETSGNRGVMGLQPHVAYDFKVKSFDIVREDGNWKLDGVN